MTAMAAASLSPAPSPWTLEGLVREVAQVAFAEEGEEDGDQVSAEINALDRARAPSSPHPPAGPWPELP